MKGFTLIETLFALCIIVLALSIVYLAPTWMYRSASYAELQSVMLDLAFSHAERAASSELSDLPLVDGKAQSTYTYKASSGQEVLFVCDLATGTLYCQSKKINTGTITVYPMLGQKPGKDEDFYVQLTVFLKGDKQ
jgi:prepilin-type N-terminal cleavage/methylation domain-containing protein